MTSRPDAHFGDHPDDPVTGSADGRTDGLTDSRTDATAAGPVLALVVSAAGHAPGVRAGLVEPLVAEGWRVAVTLTPTVATWFAADGEAARLEALTGLPVRSTGRLPTDPRPHPDPDVCAVTPATAGTVAKLALGISDSQATTVANEMICRADVPVVLLPSPGSVHLNHPAWPGHLAVLRSAGVQLVAMTAGRPGSPWVDVLTRIRAAVKR